MKEAVIHVPIVTIHFNLDAKKYHNFVKDITLLVCVLIVLLHILILILEFVRILIVFRDKEINALNVDNFINSIKKEIDALLLILIVFNQHNFNVFLAVKDTMLLKMYANYFLLIAYNQTKKVNV